MSSPKGFFHVRNNSYRSVSNYVPHYTKKRQVLARKEQQLRRLIERGESTPKIIAAADEVREARIRALRAERATIAPAADGGKLGRLARIDERIQTLIDTPVENLLAEFGFCVPGEQGES